MIDKETLYARWLDGELTAEEIKELKADGTWTELEALVKATSDMSLPAYDKDQVFDTLKKDRSDKATALEVAPTITLGTIISAAASLALLLGAIFFLRESAPVATAAFAETITHTLPDQSVVTLNDGSSISYDEDQWQEARVVKLTGEAFFDVASGQKFTVSSDIGTVEVLGTSFNVRSWDDRFLVECYHGNVMVSYKGKQVELAKNQGVYSENLTLGEVETIDNHQPVWKTGNSKFNNDELDHVFAELERQYDITIKRPSINKKFTGTFVHNNLNTALKQITKPMDLDFETNDEITHVIITE